MMMSCQQEKESSWGDLPWEICSLILSRLFGKEVALFRGVCRHWNSAPSPNDSAAPITHILKSPFLLRYISDNNNNNVFCELYSPVYNKTYYWIDAPRSLYDGAQIHCSNHGWLLLSRGDNFFFLHPSTNSIVKLPNLSYVDDDESSSFNRMSFSAPPTSPDCVVFGLVDMFSDDHTVYISFIRRGDSSWNDDDGGGGGREYPNKTRLNFRRKRLLVPRRRSCCCCSCPPKKKKKYWLGLKVKTSSRCEFPSIPCKGYFEWSTSCCAPVFHKGAFYCLSQEGILGVFNPWKRNKENRWRLVNKPYLPFCEQFQSKAYLMESSSSSKKELISVVVGPRGESVRVFQFNELMRQWQVLGCIKDQAIFLSSTSSIVLSCEKEEVMKGLGLENTVHFPTFDDDGNNMKKYNIFYSLSTGKFYSFEGRYSFENLCDTQLLLNSTWIRSLEEYFGGGGGFFSDQSLDWLSKDIMDIDDEQQQQNFTTNDAAAAIILVDKKNYDLKQQQYYYSHKNNNDDDDYVAPPLLGRRPRPWVIVSHREKEEEVHSFVNLLDGGVSHWRGKNMEARLRGKSVFWSDNNGMLGLLDFQSGDCALINTSSSPSMDVQLLPNIQMPKNFRKDCCLLHLPASGQDSNKFVLLVFGVLEKKKKKKNVAMRFMYRLGDEEWTTCTGGVAMYTVATCKDRIYGIGRPLTEYDHDPKLIRVYEIELQPKHCSIKAILEEEVPRGLYQLKGSLRIRRYLVESCDQLFFFHMRTAGFYQIHNVVVDIKAYRIDMNTMRLRVVKDFGDKAFFLSWSGGNFGYCAATKYGFQKNNIYFTFPLDPNLYRYDYANHSISVSLSCPSVKTCSMHELVLLGGRLDKFSL